MQFVDLFAVGRVSMLRRVAETIAAVPIPPPGAMR
jgi:hypothetical protein